MCVYTVQYQPCRTCTEEMIADIRASNMIGTNDLSV
jgi:hypothetical protein